MDLATASNPADYRLAEAGPDGAFGTVDDVTYTVVASYNDDARATTLTFTAPHTELPVGSYRLTLDGTAGLVDSSASHKPLAGGVNQALAFAVAPKSSIATLDVDMSQASYYGGAKMDVTPDGTALVVYPNNPTLDRENWPQIMVGQYDANGQSAGPYRTVPTDIVDSFRVVNPDVAARRMRRCSRLRRLYGLRGV